MEDRTMQSMERTDAALVLCLTLFLACSIKAPEVKVTGEKTALEKEVLGTYSEIEMEADTWMVASTRAAKGEGEVKISSEKRKVFEALQEQKYNKDDVDEFKRKGYIGENNQGFLEIRSPDALGGDPAKMKLVSEIIEEENADRRIIMERIVELKDSLKKAETKEVFYVFAQIKQKDSPDGTWIQQQEGNWVRK